MISNKLSPAVKYVFPLLDTAKISHYRYAGCHNRVGSEVVVFELSLKLTVLQTH